MLRVGGSGLGSNGLGIKPGGRHFCCLYNNVNNENKDNSMLFASKVGTVGNCSFSHTTSKQQETPAHGAHFPDPPPPGWLP